MKKGQLTQLRLLELATEAIAEVGIDKVTVRSLAERAQVSPGLINRYFPEFSTLLNHVVRYIFDEVTRVVRTSVANETAEQKLLRVIDENFAIFAIEKPHYNKCLCLSYCYIGTNEVITEIHQTMIAGAIQAAEQHFARFAKEESVAMSEEEISLFARSFMQQLEGGLIHCSFIKSQEKRKAFANQYREGYRSRLRKISQSGLLV